MVQVQILIEVILWKMKEILSRDSKITKKSDFALHSSYIIWKFFINMKKLLFKRRLSNFKTFVLQGYCKRL